MVATKRDRFERRTGITPQDYDVLARVPLFQGLDRKAMQSLLADAWVQSFARNTVLFLQEEPASRFYVVFDGWVKLFRETEEGGESVIAVFTHGESFAEAAIFDEGIFPVSAAVVADSRLLVIPAASFLKQFRENSDYALNIMAAMSRHLRRLVQQVEQLAVKSSAERVAGFLARLAPEESGPVVVRLPLDKALIAGRLGMQPETFSRSLAKLRELGVETRGDQVAIADTAGLRKFSRGVRGSGCGGLVRAG
jgi:CRP-like cAMP-binding protein